MDDFIGMKVYESQSNVVTDVNLSVVRHGVMSLQ